MKRDIINLPGSSPEVRSHINGLQYKQMHGKAPLIEKRDTRQRYMAAQQQDGGKDYPNPY
jgi:hypothetical protein